MIAAPVIRRAAIADAERLALLHAEGFPDGWTASAVAGLLARETVRGFIAVRPDIAPGPLAFILTQGAAGECEILSLVTTAATRRKGFASALVRAAAQEAMSGGAGEMFLEVAEDNTPAQALYAALGFRAAGRRRGYYRAGKGALMDALILRAALPLREKPRDSRDTVRPEAGP